MSRHNWRWRTLSGSLRRAGIWVLLLLTWEAAFRLIRWSPSTFPAPSQIIDTLLALAGIHPLFGTALAHASLDHLLAHALLVSGSRLIIGFALTASIGVGLGLLIFSIGELDRMLGPVFLGLQALPSVCWVPLAVLLPGLGPTEKGVIFVTVMGSTFAVAIALRDGLRGIPGIYQRAGTMLGAHGWRLYRYVIFPSSLPALTGALRLGFSFCWRSLMGAEVLFVAVAPGLGFLLKRGSQDVRQIVAVLVVMVLVGVLADRWLFATLQHRINMRFGLASTPG